MEVELLKLIYDYSIAGKLADQEYIEKLVEIIVSNRRLDDYVKTIGFVNNFEKSNNLISVACYSSLNEKIMVDLESVAIVVDKQRKYDKLYNTYFEKIMHRNLFVTGILLHELEHAYQNKKAEDISDKTIEANIVRACLSVNMMLRDSRFIKHLKESGFSISDINHHVEAMNRIYLHNYIFDPCERLAQVYSNTLIFDAVRPIKDKVPNLWDYIYTTTIEDMLIGYKEAFEKGYAPTEIYLNAIGQIDVWKKLDFYHKDYEKMLKKAIKKHSLAERLTLGLPVMYEEYENHATWLRNRAKFSA